MSTMQNIAVLGATGSIGASTLDVIARHPTRFRVAALTANRQVDELAELCRRYRPDMVCLADSSQLPRLRERVAGLGCRILTGEEGLVEAASSPDIDCVIKDLRRNVSENARILRSQNLDFDRHRAASPSSAERPCSAARPVLVMNLPCSAAVYVTATLSTSALISYALSEGSS